MKRIFSVTISAAVILLMGCDKNELPVPLEYSIPAKLKVNYASAYAANPFVQLKINDQRVSESIKYAYPYPGGGLNTQGGSQPDYLSVPTGSIKVSIAIPKVGTNTDSIELFSTNVTIPDNDTYTFHISDTLANTKTVLLKENTATPDSGMSRYRFVNLIPNLPAADLYFNNVKVASNIAYNTASDFFTVTYPTASAWAVRPAGAAPTTTAIASYNNTSPNQRVLTVYARGFVGATDVNRRPNVSLYYVR
jgi:hypothetical protein